MRLSNTRQAELERLKEGIRSQWLIAEEIGEPICEAEKVFELVLEEMKFTGANHTTCLSVAAHARLWVETGRYHHIDAALLICSEAKVTPLEALAEQVAKVARARFYGEGWDGSGTKIRKAGAKDWVMLRMAKLCAAGATREQAASKAARWLYEMDAEFLYKASTLEKAYTQEWQDLSAQMARQFDNDPERLAHWRKVLEELPDVPTDLKGERR